MKKKARQINIKINFTNRWLYTLIAIGILAIIGVGIYAYGTNNPSVFGHSASELAPPTGCTSGQLLQYNGNTWVCSNPGITSETDPTVKSWAKTDSPSVPGDIATFGVVNLMTTLRYVNTGENSGGHINPRCPCDISDTATDCGANTGSLYYTRSDVGSICYDWYRPQNDWSRKWTREIGGPWVMKTYN
jgi:hypothetical protein